MKIQYLVVLVLILGCSPQKQTDAVNILDRTEKQMTIDGKALFELYREIDFGSVTFTVITDQSLTQSKTVRKEKSKPYLLRVEREEQQKQVQYQADFMDALGLYNTPSEALKQSYVFSVLGDQLHRLSKSKASQKFILVIGDLCENTHNFRFYDYRKDPARILEDYDLIVEVLERQSPRLKDADLRGIKISVVYHPDKDDDDLLRYVREFWSRYFQSRHVEIDFVTSLENSSLIQGL